MIKEITKKEIEELEETSLRLHTYLKRLWEEYDGFKRIYKSLKRKIKISFSDKEIIELDMFREYCYYQGKLMAYIYVLESHYCFEVPQIIKRLRGIKLDKLVPNIYFIFDRDVSDVAHHKDYINIIFGNKKREKMSRISAREFARRLTKLIMQGIGIALSSKGNEAQYRKASCTI